MEEINQDIIRLLNNIECYGLDYAICSGSNWSSLINIDANLYGLMEEFENIRDSIANHLNEKYEFNI